jgi:hypothetical protein
MAIISISAQIQCDRCKSTFTLPIPAVTRIPGSSTINDFIIDAVAAGPKSAIADNEMLCENCKFEKYL